MKPTALFLLALVVGAASPGRAQAQASSPERPFGTLREQATLQQDWLKKRLDQFLPALMRKHGIDLWVVPMREYNEDPVFSAITAPQTFAARRRTIYVFFDKCAASGAAAAASCVERIALGGTSQGGLYTAYRGEGSTSNTQKAELWGMDQWRLFARLVKERNPKAIAVNARNAADSMAISVGSPVPIP